jgi:hypothetical protein
VHRHFLGAALHIKRAGKPRCLQPFAQRVAQQLAPLAEGHLHQLADSQCPRPPAGGCGSGTMRTTALSTRGGGSNDSGGTNSTFSMA